MEEKIRTNYFLAVKLIMVAGVGIYAASAESKITGASSGVFLFLALFLALVIGKSMTTGKTAGFLTLALLLILVLLAGNYGIHYGILGIILYYEILSLFPQAGLSWYLLSIVILCIPMNIPLGTELLLCLLLGVIYAQHNLVIENYRRRMREDNFEEQKLKENMDRKELLHKEEMNQGMLVAENRILEEKEQLSQTLHDKLGHSINGSIYQLEAVKVLLKQDTATSLTMIQAVIDNLRNGMDEIRAILRKERPQKYKVALLQLHQLCEECNSMGILTELVTKGDMESIPGRYLEIILDNAFEAVSNALKYAKCTQICINIHIMNQVVRCSVSDNGIGCSNITDGMGIAGMRKRMRSANGILDFESEAGFRVNMLIPLEKVAEAAGYEEKVWKR